MLNKRPADYQNNDLKIYGENHCTMRPETSSEYRPSAIYIYIYIYIWKHIRYDIEALVEQSSQPRFTVSILQSLVDDRHPRFGERAVASRFMARFTPVCAWPSVFSPRFSPLCLFFLLLSCRSERPRRLFRRKEGSSSSAGSWPDIVCHTLASTPTLHLLYSPPFARCTLVKPRFIMRRI